MPTNYTGRLVTIFVVVWIALSAMFPRVPGSLFWIIRPGTEISFEPNLKPGIDMVGGTSLLYEIKQPEGGYSSASGRTLAEEVMDSLKKRVDPQGVRNLIWRPQGNTRLEIQMPLTKASGQSKARREAFGAAQEKLEATNVRVVDVLTAVEELKGDERDQRLVLLSQGAQVRKDLFTRLTATWDEIQKARGAKDAAAQAAAETRYDALKDEIARTNLSSQSLQDLLDLKGDSRAAKLSELKQRYSGWSDRLSAIESFSEKYVAFAEIKGAIDDAGELKRLLRGSGVLSFHILAIPPGSPGHNATVDADTYKTMVERLQKDGPQVRANDTVRWFAVDRPDEFRGQTVTYNDRHFVLAFITPDRSMVNRPGLPAWGLDSAGANNSDGMRKVSFTFNPAGAKLFGDLTGANVGRPLGIVLDDKLISAPNIEQQIMGQGVIRGGGAAGFTAAEQRYLISTLGAGSLPAQLTEDPISERTVGPQLGEDNLRAGFAACIVGMIVVAVFLIGYYYLAGLVAFIAVCVNLVLILGVMAALNATFTLPGVAGIVLSVGAAVDANVLIFERLREEQHRGLSLRMALRNSYDRAWSAIVDSNMTTVITAGILYWLGTEEVKGFGITLLIGLVSSLFTSLYVTKTIFAILIDKIGVTDLRSLPRTFPKWDQMLQPKVDWIGMTKYFATVSTIVVVVGCAAFWYYGRKGELLDIEFASGTSVQLDLKEPMSIADVRALVQDDPAIPSPAVVSVGNDDRSYEVVSTSAEAAQVKAAILARFGDRLALERPSRFVDVDARPEDVLDRLVIPVTRDTLDRIKLAAGGFLPGNWQSYRGGAAIVLKDVSPRLTPRQIRERIDRQRLQATPGQAQGYRDIAVESPLGPSEPTSTAVVFVADPLLPYDLDPARWKSDLAGPSWTLIAEALNRPAQLSKVSNFDAQVAGDTQRDAMLALLLSLGVIMGYIWLRFGNLKYGAATMIAMLHDTLMVISAIGLSHVLVHAAPGIAGAMLLEPFRLNITIVAAILTVMSFSMLDTIVVFDRVRENRGKYGVLSKQLLNDSINQTMSRTLLTAGTNIVTLFFMYVFGGPGIHGFTFVLLFGILVGTYSSIAIAAPLLLVGIGRERSTAGPSGESSLQRQDGRRASATPAGAS